MMIAFIVTPTIYNFPKLLFFVLSGSLEGMLEEMGGNGLLLTCR